MALPAPPAPLSEQLGKSASHFTMDKKIPYVLLERINVDSQKAVEHGIRRIAVATRRPIVLVEKLPIAITDGLSQSGDSRGQARKSPKRPLSPSPSRRASPDTPTKRAHLAREGPRKHPHMRLWTGPKSKGKDQVKSSKENGTSQYYPHTSLWEDQAPQPSLQSAISSAKNANLSVLLGVRSRGIPIVELERLQGVPAYKLSDASSQASLTTSDRPPAIDELIFEDTESECSDLEFPKASRRRNTSQSPRKVAPVKYQETESSDDNWSVSSLRLWR